MWGSQQCNKQETWLHLCMLLPTLLGMLPSVFSTSTKGNCFTNGKEFFSNDKTHSNLKGNGNLYFDYFQCIDIVLLCKRNCKTLLRYCIENTHRKKTYIHFHKNRIHLGKITCVQCIDIIEPNLHRHWRKMFHLQKKTTQNILTEL